MFAIIATVLSGVCMVVTAVATAIPYWVHASVAGVTVNIGLWKLCGSKPGFSSQCTDWPEGMLKDFLFFQWWEMI